MKAPLEKISLAILAGGFSRRMGEDKALMVFAGHPLIKHVADRLSGLAEETLLITNCAERYAFLGMRLCADLLPRRGPLGGIYTALASASFPIVAVAACDMPFASKVVFDQAIKLLRQENTDAVLPRSDKGLEPLHAVYRRTACLPVIQSAVEAGQFKAIDWLTGVRLGELSKDTWGETDPTGKAFWNINTPEEFMQAEREYKLGKNP